MASSGIVRQRTGNSLVTRDRMSMRRVIIKQSYLTKLPNAARIGASFKNPHRRWFVFGVMNGTDPYLEYYQSEDSVFLGTPINMFFLDSCKKVVKQKNHSRYENLFTVVLRDRNLSLFADTRTLMAEWCTAISRKLMSMGVFVDDNDEHIYVDNPVSRALTREERDRFYPNRPPNVLSCDRTQPIDNTGDTPNGQGETPAENAKVSNGIEEEAYEEPQTSQRENSYMVPTNEHTSIPLTNGSHAIALETPPQSPPSTTDTSASSPLEHFILFGNTEAHPITMATPPPTPLSPTTPALPMTPVSPTDSTYMNFPSLRPLSSDLSPPEVSNFEPTISLLTPKVLEASGENPPEDAVVGWNMPPPDHDAPPLYLPQEALERGANRSLKLSQVEQVRQERDNSGGVRVILKKIDCLYAIAFVDCFNAVWVAGWNQKARPRLHNCFHIGDQLVSVNGQVVESAKIALKLIKNCKEDSDKVTFVLRRVPYARILAMRRHEDSGDLGIQTNGGTAEIIQVDEMGVASEAGLSQRAITAGGNDFCNWWITEINHRPLSLFFKDDEISKRLNAVGRDISIMVHPSHFINEVKRKLKVYRNYKDFLLQ